MWKTTSTLLGVGRLNLLGDFNPHLVEAAAQIVGQQRVPVSGQVLGREATGRRSVQQRGKLGGIHVVVSFQAHGAYALLFALFDVVDHGERGGL